MARPQAYNEHAVIDSATNLFNMQGYRATSIEQLLETTKISRSSLYHGFGNKEGLFLRALDLKAKEGVEVYNELVKLPTLREQLRTFLCFQKPQHPYQAGIGCLLINTVVELGDSEPTLVNRALFYLQQTEELVAKAIQAGQKSGEVPLHLDAPTLARFFMSVKKGLLVSVRHGCDMGDLNETVDTAMQIIWTASIAQTTKPMLQQ